MRVLSATLCLLILAACASPVTAPARTSRTTPDATAAPDSGGVHGRRHTTDQSHDLAAVM